jgi:hypothetical protein
VGNHIPQNTPTCFFVAALRHRDPKILLMVQFQSREEDGDIVMKPCQRDGEMIEVRTHLNAMRNVEAVLNPRIHRKIMLRQIVVAFWGNHLQSGLGQVAVERFCEPLTVHEIAAEHAAPQAPQEPEPVPAQVEADRAQGARDELAAWFYSGFSSIPSAGPSKPRNSRQSQARLVAQPPAVDAEFVSKSGDVAVPDRLEGVVLSSMSVASE